MFWDEESESDDCDISDDEYRSDIEPMDEPITREEESDTNTESNEEAHDESIDTSFWELGDFFDDCQYPWFCNTRTESDTECEEVDEEHISLEWKSCRHLIPETQ